VRASDEKAVERDADMEGRLPCPLDLLATTEGEGIETETKRVTVVADETRTTDEADMTTKPRIRAETEKETGTRIRRETENAAEKGTETEIGTLTDGETLDEIEAGPEIGLVGITETAAAAGRDQKSHGKTRGIALRRKRKMPRESLPNYGQTLTTTSFMSATWPKE